MSFSVLTICTFDLLLFQRSILFCFLSLSFIRLYIYHVLERYTVLCISSPSAGGFFTHTLISIMGIIEYFVNSLHVNFRYPITEFIMPTGILMVIVFPLQS